MRDQLSDAPGSFVNGAWDTDSAEWMDAMSPATGEVLARLSKSSRETARRAIAAASAAQPVWAETTVWKRVGGRGTCSGIGRIGGRATLKAMTEMATVTLPATAL